MPPLPSGIEAALLDSGFSGTELLVLQRLLEDDALTLRQIAQKTGKGTGVLDLGTKKLLKKGIVHKEDINHTPKYAMSSLQAITAWIQQDTKEKQEILRRRHESIESFLSSLTLQKQRPDLQHFVGEEGIKQGYIHLLSLGGEFLQYFPAVQKDEEDPFQEFRVHYFRLRRQRNIFSRTLAPDTPLGRRFQSRDSFEFRKTVLLKKPPIPFEKIIVGNTVACFNHEKMMACFIHYPALADAERGQFEFLWNGGGKAEETAPIETKTSVSAPAEHIPLKTRLVSDLRRFFLSRASLYSFLVFTVLASAATVALYRYNVYLNTQRLREKAMAIAATGALQFGAEEVGQIHTLKDLRTPIYQSVTERLISIRANNEKVIYAYIFRPNPDSTVFEFIADADAINPFHEMDLNDNGTIDPLEEVIWPGRSYDVSHIEPLRERQYEQVSATDTPYKDQWGAVLTGYAPIRNGEGEIVAVLGVDISADEIGNLSRATFRPVSVFFAILMLFIFIRILVIAPNFTDVKLRK